MCRIIVAYAVIRPERTEPVVWAAEMLKNFSNQTSARHFHPEQQQRAALKSSDRLDVLGEAEGVSAQVFELVV